MFWSQRFWPQSIRSRVLKGQDLLGRRGGIRAATGLCASILLLSTACSEPIEKVWQYQSFSASYSSPAIAKDLILFGTASGEIHAVSKDGGFRWKFQTRKEVVSAPAVVDNLILFGSTNHNFYAIDYFGRQVWKYTTFSRIKGDPLVDKGTVIFGSYDKHLYALEADSRNEVWVYPPDVGAAAEAKKAEEEAATEPQDDAKDGEEAPKVAAPSVDKSKWPGDAFSYAQPILTSTGLVVVGNLDGYLYAIDRKTGALAWRWASEGAATKKGITSTVLEKDGVLYFGANDANVYALNLADQKVLWKFKTGDEVNSSPVIDDKGTLFIGSRDSKLYALDAKTGKEVWTFPTQGPILSHPAIYKNLVIFGAGQGDGHVYAVDTNSGKEFWKFKTGDAVDADPVIDGDRFYIASGDKNLYAFKINKTVP